MSQLSNSRHPPRRGMRRYDEANKADRGLHLASPGRPTFADHDKPSGMAPESYSAAFIFFDEAAILPGATPFSSGLRYWPV